jgi:4-hydroxy-tetrahydrodipicolinate synthase
VLAHKRELDLDGIGREDRLMTAATPFRGLFVPLITPFTDDGDLDPRALAGLACRVLDAGATGLVALGTTAEAPTLTAAERSTVLDVCARVCRERGVPLIAGAGSGDTRQSAAALGALAAWPEISAALVVVPYYSRPGEDGVVAHFRALAQDSPVPLIVYNIPYRTGQQVGWQAMGQIARLPGLAGVKHAAGGIDRETVIMMAGAPAGFAVLAGDDLYAPAMLALGAAGAIMASAHVCTDRWAQLVAAWRAGDAATARPLGHRLAGLADCLFAEPNPTVIKAVLYRLGQIASPAVRLPLLPARPESAEAALAAAAALTTVPAPPAARASSAGQVPSAGPAVPAAPLAAAPR